MRIPNAEKAFVDIEKLCGYCLNIHHERGKHKARLFQSILGINSDDSEILKKKLLEAVCLYDAQEGVEDQYGKRYVLDFIMTTKKGKANVRSTWIIRTHENFARLTSCYIIKSKGQYYE
jgi:hypothetical protein